MATITFIRHGNAEKWSGKVEEDHDRPLSEKGIAQAEKRRSKLGNPTFDLIISSSATRCVSTAKIIAGEKNPPEVITASRLYIPEDSALWETFERIGYAPLREWMQEENDPDGVLQRYGSDAWTIIDAIKLAILPERILVTGHAPLLNAIGVRCENRVGSEALFDIQLEECEGFVMDNDKITLIQG